MKLAVVGSRHFWCYEIVEKHINLIREDHNVDLIISGGAPGVDTMAESYARTNNIPLRVFPAKWDKYGKAAGPIRNKKIVDECDMVLAFLEKGSKGTQSTIDIANREGKEVIIINI